MTKIAQARNVASPAQIAPVRVCMHVLNHLRADIRAQRASASLVKAGFSVTLIDIEGKGKQPLEEITSGAHTKHLMVPQCFIATRFKRWAMIRSAWLFILGVIELMRTQADIYHALDLPALPACYIAGRLRHKPVIFEAYELPLATFSTSAMSRGQRWLHQLMAPLLAHILPRCAGAITVSPAIIDEFHLHYHCPSVALVRNISVYQTVGQSNRLRQRLGLGAEVHVALYQGYLQVDRGLDLLIRAAAFLKPGTVIVMMGKSDAAMQENLETLITREGVGDRVKILPPVPYDELLNWTASADIGLIIYDPTYARNVEVMLPNKLFEYLMAGLPVLSSLLPEVKDILDTYHVGNVVSSLAPQAIAAAIDDMIANCEMLAKMRTNALRIASEEFHWEKESQHLLNLYQHILEAHHVVRVRCGNHPAALSNKMCTKQK